MSYTFSNKNHRSALAIFGFQRFVTIPIAEFGLKSQQKKGRLITTQLAWPQDAIPEIYFPNLKKLCAQKAIDQL